jgi:hypothetical protein
LPQPIPMIASVSKVMSDSRKRARVNPLTFVL